ncbi:MAG: acyltransferase [Akkermansia sp.]|nr:acyltransferase [Akkermansia sp.]
MQTEPHCSPPCPRHTARQSNLELLRILSMLLIVLHHYALHGLCPMDKADPPAGWQVEILQFGGGVGVALFVLISSYFMVSSRFSGRKFMRLWVPVVTISMSLYLAFRFIPQEGITPHGGILAMCTQFLPILSGQYWFITTFTLLMLLSPALNMVMQRAGRMQIIGIIAVLAAFCCAPTVIPYVAYSSGEITLFILLYFLAGYMRLHGRSPQGHAGACLVAFLVILAATEAVVAATCGAESIFLKSLHKACAAKFGIPNLLMAVFLFRAFLGMNLGSSKWINSIAACTLGVYLIHDNAYMRPFLWRNIFHCRDMLAQGPAAIWWHCITTVLAVYIGCTILAFIWKQTVERAYITWVEPRLLPLLRRAGGYAAGGLDKFCKRYIDRD